MNPAIFGYFVGQFVGSLLLAVIWLLISKAIPPLRREPAITYSIAVVFGFVPVLVTLDEPSYSGFLAALLCAALLFWQYKRAKAKLRAAAADTPRGA
jgi:hypothetical protein